MQSNIGLQRPPRIIPPASAVSGAVRTKEAPGANSFRSGLGIRLRYREGWIPKARFLTSNCQYLAVTGNSVFGA
jgi:hypothetical protein